MTTPDNPQHSPDLAAADFHLFPLTKWTLKGRCLCNATDVIKNVTEELKRLLQNGFLECVVAKGDCFERNVAYVIVLFCISQK